MLPGAPGLVEFGFPKEAVSCQGEQLRAGESKSLKLVFQTSFLLTASLTFTVPGAFIFLNVLGSEAQKLLLLVDCPMCK